MEEGKQSEGERRICIIQRGQNGFGFILCCENETTDTYVLHVLALSPACTAGLKPGDRIIEVNGINVEDEEHKAVVERLQGLQSIRLVVAHNAAAEKYFEKPANGMTVKPLDAGNKGLRPRLITVHRTPKGFDFCLQTVGKSKRSGKEKHRLQLKGISGHYASSVYEKGAAYEAGLREGHRLIAINGVDIEKESHAYVIRTIKTANKLELLVVDKDTDEFFQRHGVSPTSKHTTGELEFSKPSPPTSPSSLHSEPVTPPKDSLKKKKHFNPSTPVLLRDVGYSTPLQMSSARLPSMAMSTPNLVDVGRSPSYHGLDDPFDRVNRKQRTASAKREIKKRLSKLERRPFKSGYNKVELHGNRKLYDDTEIGDVPNCIDRSPSSLSPSYVDHRLRQLSIHDRHSPTSRMSRSVSDLSKSTPSLAFSPKLSPAKERLYDSYEHSECDSPPPGYESPEELSQLNFNVDLKTLKDRVRKKSSQSKNDAARAKSKLSDYSLAHMYVNSY